MRIVNETEKCQGKWTRVNTANRSEKSGIDYFLVSQNLWETIKEMEIDEEEIHKLKGKKPTDHNTIIVNIDLQIEPKEKHEVSSKVKNKQKNKLERIYRRGKENRCQRV